MNLSPVPLAVVSRKPRNASYLMTQSAPARFRSLRRIDNKGHVVRPADCGPTGEGKTDEVDPCKRR